MSDPVEILTAAAAEAQVVLAAYLEPGGPDAAETISRLLGILDDEAVLGAVDAIGPPPCAAR